MFGKKKSKNESINSIINKKVEVIDLSNLNKQTRANLGFKRPTDDLDSEIVEIAKLILKTLTSKEFIKTKSLGDKKELVINGLSNKNIVLACFAILKEKGFNDLSGLGFYYQFSPELCNDSDFIKQAIVKYSVPIHDLLNLSKSRKMLFDSQKDKSLATDIITERGYNIEYFSDDIKSDATFLTLAVTSKKPYMPKNAYGCKEAVLAVLKSDAKDFCFGEHFFEKDDILVNIMQNGALDDFEISQDKDFIEEIINIYKSKRIEEIKELNPESKMFDYRKDFILHTTKREIEDFRKSLKAKHPKSEDDLTPDQKKAIDDIFKL